MDKSFGVLVTAVNKGGPAEEAGLKVGDVVMAVQGIRADNVDVLGYRLSTAGIGNTVTLDIVRNGKDSKLPVKLAKEPEAKPQQKQTIKGDNPFEGAVVEELTPSMASRCSCGMEHAVSSLQTSFLIRKQHDLVSVNAILFAVSTAIQSVPLMI